MRGTDVTIPGDPSRGDPPSPAYASLPDGATKAVVVIHEIFGRAPDVDAVVDRFAARGYAAVAPDLFAHGQLACIRAVMRAMKTGDDVAPVRLAHRARAWLSEKSAVPFERTGLIGFCFGGGFALLAGSGWAAVSTNYGEVPPAERMRGIGPVIGCYGGRDVPFRKAPSVLRERLAVVGVTPEVHVYPTAGHAFLTDGKRPVASALTWPLLHVHYDPVVAAEAWEKIDAFFDRHLGA
jgi:carboxymethylenebutenolidase